MWDSSCVSLVTSACVAFSGRSVHPDLLRIGVEWVWRHVHDLHFTDGKRYFTKLTYWDILSFGLKRCFIPTSPQVLFFTGWWFSWLGHKTACIESAIKQQQQQQNNYICPKISFWEPFFHWTFSFHFIAGEFFLGMVSAFVHCWVSLLFDLVVACWGCNLCRPLCGYNIFCEWNVIIWTVHRVWNMKPLVTLSGYPS